jgi:hypothetical protein
MASLRSSLCIRKAEYICRTAPVSKNGNQSFSETKFLIVEKSIPAEAQ